MRKELIVGAVAGGLAALGAVVAARTARFQSPQVDVASAAPGSFALPGAPERFARGLTYRTISYQDPADLPAAEFEAFNAYLIASFPRAHAALQRDVVGGYSLLYTWPGSDPTLPGILVMGHHDVVPVLPGTDSDWTHPPYDGVIADGFIWGRGALDNKAPVFGSLEAVEALLAAGFQPKRTVYLAFGHDEEMGGMQGAYVVADLLKSRGARIDFVLDEGGDIIEGVFEGVSEPVATIGVAEKGYASVELSVKSEGGHSSMPPRETAIGILAKALARLEANGKPAAIAGVTRQMLEALGPLQGPARRVALANLWLFRPLVECYLAQTPATNALIRTTTAPTMLSGSIKDNILPIEAKAVVNFRIMPGDSVAGVLDHIARVVADPRVVATPIDYPTEPSPVSSTTSPAYRLIARKVRELFPGTIVTPYLVVGQTDSRHYAPISENVYRFLPTRTTKADLARIHGTDERIAVADYELLVRFLGEVIRESTG